MHVLWVFVGMLILMFLRVPVAVSMGLAAGSSLLLSGVPMVVIPQRMFGAVNSFTMMAIPFFVFVGEAMNTGGVSNRIFNFARTWVRHITGSLGHVNVIASIIFAGMSGSAVSDAYGLGLIEIEAMKKSGYDDEFSAAITAASSTIGPIIPPSIPLVLYAVLAEQSVGRLFLGGFLPGVSMGAALMILVYIISKKKGYPVEPKASMSERLKATFIALPSLMTPLFLFASIVFGIVTPTEGATIVGVYALVLGFFIHREMGVKTLYRIILKSVKGSSSILLIISSASVLTWVILSSNLPALITNSLLQFTQNKYIILLLINLILLVMGCLMEGTSIIMIMVPLLLPIAQALGIDLVHLGVVVVLNVMLGNVTPPVGLCLYVTANIAGITSDRMARAILVFLVPLFIVLFTITYIPQIVLFLPRLLMG